MKYNNISVVGGGPAGSTCGYYLAKSGFDVTIYEAAPNTRKCCGGGLRKATFSEFGDLTKGIKEKSYPVKSCHLRFNGISKTVKTSGVFAYVTDRKMFDSKLLEAAKKEGCKMVTRAADPDKLNADLIVDARGAYHGKNKVLMVAAVCKMKEPEFTIEIISKYNKLGYFWIFPMSDKLANIGVGDFKKIPLKKHNEALDWYIKRNNATMVWRKAWQESPGVRYDIFANAKNGTRTVRIGERAGLVNPLTGEGIYYAMKSGKTLSSAIADNNILRYRIFIEKVRFEFLYHKILRDIALRPWHKPKLAFWCLKFLGVRYN